MKLIIALLLFPAIANANQNCSDGFNDTDTYVLEGADLSLHSGTPEGWPAFGRAACVFYSEPSLEDLRVKVENHFRQKVEKNFEKHLKLGQPKLDVMCKFDSVNGLAGVASFDEIEGNSPLDQKLDETDCYGDRKIHHFATVKIPFANAEVKMRCGKKEFVKEWMAACTSRDPSSIKKKRK